MNESPAAPENAHAAGYQAEVEYTRNLCRELAPSWLRYIAQFNGMSAPMGDRFAYYDLGCGQGDTMALLAACHPRARFIGVDLMESHMDNARGMAREAGLSNVEFLARSFADLLTMDLPAAEFVVMHGVWSWVPGAPRDQIIAFLAKRLKPGGLVYVSFNALPGSAGIQALRRLMVEHAGAATGALMEHIAGAAAFARSLNDVGALFFDQHRAARARLEHIANADPRYLAHEYFNDNWTPFYHTDVAADLKRAGLVYVGQAKPINDMDGMVLRPTWIRKVEDFAQMSNDRGRTKTIKDFVRNRAFRADVFMRPLGGPAPEGEPLRLALYRPRQSCTLEISTTAGTFKLAPGRHAPILDALARGPMTLGELARAPENSDRQVEEVRMAVFGLTAAEQIGPALTRSEAEDPACRDAARRFNQALVLSRAVDRAAPALASPVLGTGIALAPLDQALTGAPDDPDAAVEHALRRLPMPLGTIIVDGKPITGEKSIRAALRKAAPLHLSRTRPYLRQMGIEA